MWSLYIVVHLDAVVKTKMVKDDFSSGVVKQEQTSNSQELGFVQKYPINIFIKLIFIV